MKKAIEFILNYREAGKQGTTLLKVDFVSNWVMREYNDIVKVSFETKGSWDTILYKMAEIKSLQVERPDDYDLLILALDEEIKVLTEKIKDVGETNILNRRFELLKIILTDNGITESRLHSFEFWDRCVDPQDMIDFLTQCAWKDIDKKKLQ